MSWEKYRIKDFTEVITGGTPSTLKKEYWDNGTIPWLNSGELNADIVVKSDNYITDLGLKNSSARLMPNDTVLIALTGATTGVVGYLTIEACANQSVTGILPSKNHHPKYLYYYLKSIRNKVISDSYGGAQKHISQAYVKELKIPLPPLNVQKRIAEILDTADALKRKDKALLKKYDELAQAIFTEMFGDPIKNEKKWEEIPIRKSAANVKHSIKAGPFGSSLKKEYYVSSGFKIYGQEQVIADNFTIGDYYISKEKFTELKNYKISTGDILISLVGTYGKISVVPNNFEPGIINPRLMKITLNNNILDPYFFKYLLQTEQMIKRIAKFSRGGTMDIVNVGIISDVITITPPHELQRAFVKRLCLIEQLKSTVRKSNSYQLFESLINKTFKGELTV